jgi:hypothetical protein
MLNASERLQNLTVKVSLRWRLQKFESSLPVTPRIACGRFVQSRWTVSLWCGI